MCLMIIAVRGTIPPALAPATPPATPALKPVEPFSPPPPNPTHPTHLPTQVEALVVPVLVTGCALGEVLDDDWAFASAFSVCRTCAATTYSLWADTRGATASAAAPADPEATASSARGLNPPAAAEGGCRKCPDHAACPGGAALLPRLGWWHSSPASPQMHKCVYADACLGPAALRGGGAVAVAVAEGRVSAVLRACQEAWYASRPAGHDVIARYTNALRLHDSNSSHNSSAGDGGGLHAAGSPTCLLWGAPSGDTTGGGSEVAAVSTGGCGSCSGEGGVCLGCCISCVCGRRW